MGLFDFILNRRKKFSVWAEIIYPEAESDENVVGQTMEDAVIIKAPSNVRGVLDEYRYIEGQCGKRDDDWKIVGQALLGGSHGKMYDMLKVRLMDGTIQEFYFEISSFFGKW